MMVAAGHLDRRIELQSASVVLDSDYNEPINTWSTYATVWAMKEEHRATETEGAGRRFAGYDLFFTIRHRTDVEPEHRIVFDGENYEIVGRPREIGRKRFLKLQVRLVE